MKTGDLDLYQKNLNKINEITDKELEIVNESENWTKEYPYLSRNCGSDIHKMIQDGVVKFVQHISIEEANDWCEGFYVIDFQKRIFSVNYYDFVKIYSLDNLPSEVQFLKDSETAQEED